MLDELLGSGAAGPDSAQPNGQSGPRVVIAHGVSYAAELAFSHRLESAAAADSRLVYVPTVSRSGEPENAGWMGRTGRVESILGAVCGELRLDPSDAVAYLCGNPEMVARSREVLDSLGFPRDAIVHENYWAAPGA